MGVTSRIVLRFPREKYARWAMHVAEEMLKVVYAPKDLPWVEAARTCLSLSSRYLEYRQEAAAYDLDIRHTALEWLRRVRTNLVIERCQDIARWDSFEDPEALFPQLCCAYVLRFPQVPFTARYRHEMTVSGALLLYCVQYDGAMLHVQEKNGMWPMEEDDWAGEWTEDYRAQDGVWVKEGSHAPERL